MGKRLSKIYTRTGDDGSTGLGDGQRVNKNSRRVETYGTVDETNSAIGLVIAEDELPEEISKCLTGIQHRLFDLGGELCIPGSLAIEASDVSDLEASLDRFNQELQPLKNFILPGGTRAAALCRFGLSGVRRANRVARQGDSLPRLRHPAPQGVLVVRWRLCDLRLRLAAARQDPPRVLGGHASSRAASNAK